MRKTKSFFKMSLFAGIALTAFSCSQGPEVLGDAAARSLEVSSEGKVVLASDLNPGYGFAVYFTGSFAENWGKAYRGSYSNDKGWTVTVDANGSFEWKALTGNYDLGEVVGRSFHGLSYIGNTVVSAENPNPSFNWEVGYGNGIFFVGNKNSSEAVRGVYSNGTWTLDTSFYPELNTAYDVYVGSWDAGDKVEGTFDGLTWADGENNVYGASVKRRALVMGNVDNSAICELDITSMAKTFASQTFDGEGFDYIEQVKNNTLQQIKDKIQAAFADTDDDDVSYITISCHGSSDGGIFIGTDAPFTGSSLRQTLDAYVRGEVVVMIDCCFAGNIIDKSVAADEAAFLENFVADFIGDNASKVGELASERFHVVCASNKNEYSYGGSIGLGINYWEKSLGWDALADQSIDLLGDADGDNKVTLAELHAYSAPNTAFLQHQVVYPENDDFVVGGRY